MRGTLAMTAAASGLSSQSTCPVGRQPDHGAHGGKGEVGKPSEARDLVEGIREDFLESRTHEMKSGVRCPTVEPQGP